MRGFWKKAKITILAILVGIGVMPVWPALGGGNAYAAESSWGSVGRAGFSNAVASYTSLYVYNGSGTSIPYVAFQDWTSGKATVMKYVSGSWAVVGDAGFSTNEAIDLSLFVYNAGGTPIPYLAFRDEVTGKATVMKFADNGSGTFSWAQVGGAVSTHAATDLSLYVESGTPHVAYQDGTDNKGYAKYYYSDWDSWEDELSSASSFSDDTASASDISLYVNDSGYPVVAYRDGASGNKVTVKTIYDVWTTIGSPGFSTNAASDISLDVDNGVFYVAYRDEANGLTVMKYDESAGSGWVPVGSADFTGGPASYVSLDVDNGIPYVAYQDGLTADNKATVMKFDGSAGTGWVPVGSPRFSAGVTYFTSLDVVNGIPYVAYMDAGNDNKATVMTYSAPAPAYAIEALTDLTFASLSEGYASGSQQIKTITVTRTGTSDLIHLAAALNGTNASNFTITPPAATTLNDTTPSTTFTLKAKDGLPAGTYTATITVTADSLTPVTFTVMQVVKAPPKTIITIAGTGIEGYSGDGGAATSAQLNYPEGVAVDSSGNVYIVDTDNHLIRKIDAITRKISTVAGTGTQGYSGDDGDATLAELNTPEGVVVDKDGNLYIADFENNRVRKVDKLSGEISTIAGTGDAGYSGDDEAATAAELDGPIAVALDSSENLYIADLHNSTIRKVDKLSGEISTIAGTGASWYSGDGGPATDAQLNYPRGVVVDGSGNVYIVDRDNERIRKVDAASGTISTIAGTGVAGYSGDGGHATEAQLNQPRGIALDRNGNLLIADKGNNRIRMIDMVKGSIITIAGTGADGYSGDGGAATSADLNSPYGVAADSSGNVYIADKDNQRLRKLVDALYTVNYNDNDSTGGSIPTDGGIYDPGAPVKVLGNTGNLAKTGYTFAGWNTQANGNGTSYAAGATFAMGSSNVILFAKWTLNSSSSSGGGGGGSGIPSSQKEIITVDVKDGTKGNGEVVSKATIERTTDANGRKKDDVTFTNEQASKTAEQLKASGSNTAKLVVPDPKDEVSELNVVLPKTSTSTLAENGLNLEIFTPNARIVIPSSSLQGLGGDKYFRLVPVKTASEREAVEERARTEQIVRVVAGNDNVEIVGRPMTIETNMQSRRVTLVLPLNDVSLTEDQLKDLGIYIEHSDGTKELVKGEIVPYDGSGKRGIQFTVNKFSTFAVVHMEGWLKSLTDGSAHKAYIAGYPDGTFGPDRNITRAEMAAILARLFDKDKKQASTIYADVTATYWARAAIDKDTAMGLMIGYTDGSFKPEASISRAEMASVVARLLDSSSSESGGSFSDISGHWAQAAIEKAKAAGIINGYEDGTFRPEQLLTRAEAVAMINKLLGRGPLSGAERKWKDVPEKYWAYGHIQEASVDHSFEKKTDGEEKYLPLP
ncbi:S-layer homology domain-containing protein [Cohnella silvisoli]|uniref:S-layer homology domain-containing protein n=1 Tax=Cohnella silvisoli TaxID=2873699 RepID=A0ABV1L3R6_9BACL|nr:S-layer homology domain-containing protein [Cohnella silvisoli]MCD9025805.1 S-layer homology domain-containing protein [Cohnella silvisoli]